MIDAPDPIFRHLRQDTGLKIVLAGFLVYWICMLPALFGSATASTAAARALTLPAMMAMYWIASVKTGELLRAVAVLGQLQAPHALRRAQLHEKLRAIGFAWLFLALGASLQLALPSSRAAAATGAALVSLAGCIGVLRAMARAGMLAPALRQLLDASPYLLVLAIVVLDQNRLLDWFGSQPFAVLALCALLLPALLANLGSRWKAALPQYRWSAPAPKGRIRSWIASQNRRSTMLTWRKTWQADAEHNFFKVNSVLGRLSMTGAPLLLMIGSPLWAGGKIDPARGLPLLIVAAWIAGALVVRDMHWRSLLRPGGLRRGRIGTHIWISTFAMQMVALLMLAALYLLIARLGFGASWEVITPRLLRAASMPLELCFLTSVAVLLRATPHSGPWTGIIFVTVLLLAGGPIFAIGKMGFEIAFPLWAFVAGSLAGTALMLAMANLAWTTRKLFMEVAKNEAS